MPGNRFEQVDDIQPDALNLTLTQTADGQNGAIHVPAAATAVPLPKPIDSGDMPVKDAFRADAKAAWEVGRLSHLWRFAQARWMSPDAAERTSWARAWLETLRQFRRDCPAGKDGSHPPPRRR